PAADDHHAVFILIHVESPARVALRALHGLCLPIDPAPAADDALDVLGGPGSADRERPLFGLWSRHTRQRADLRVRELTAGERLRQPRECSERARNSDPLAGRAGIEPDAPGQPRSARVEPVAPAAACVELADEVEKPPGGGVKVGGQLGDLVAETIHLSGAASGG